MKSKQELRKEVLAKRALLTEEERRIASLKITERILGHQWFYRAKEVLLFVSYGSEIDTTDLILESIRMGKMVYVPKVEGKELVFYKIDSLEELQEGYRGIREPAGNSSIYEYDPDRVQNTLMIMPGAVYDLYRNRIGYGRGFYDRYLCGKEELQNRSIGIGFQCQLVEEIPAEEWDLRPYQVICV